MTIMESAIAMNNDYVECTNSLDRIDLFAEASYKEYEINLKEVALKVLQENGTQEDFDFLATEAAGDYLIRAKKAIAKFVEAVKKFIVNCKNKLIEFVTNLKTNAAVDKVEAACKANPSLRSTKVEYLDTDKHIGILQQAIDRICKKNAKVTAKGVATKEDIDEIENIEADTAKKILAVSAVSLVTLGTAIAIFKSCNSKTEVEAELRESDADACDININEDTVKSAEMAAYFTKSSGILAKLQKEKSAKFLVKTQSLIAAIKKAIGSLKKKTDVDDLEGAVTESSLDELDMFACVTTEAPMSTESDKKDKEEEIDKAVEAVEDLDLDQYFEDICKEVLEDKSEEEKSEEVKPDEDKKDDEKSEDAVKESTDDVTDDTSAITYMEQLENELFGEDEDIVEESAETYMEQLEREIFGEDEDIVEESTETYMEQLEREIFGEDEIPLVLSCPRLFAGKRGTMQPMLSRPINRAFPPQFRAE